MESIFRDRTEAGEALARRLQSYAYRSDVLVLGLPRGGVVAAFALARVLHAPLDALVVRKLGVPGQEELAMGALASGGSRFLNQAVVQELGIPEQVIEEVIGPRTAGIGPARAPVSRGAPWSAGAKADRDPGG